MKRRELSVLLKTTQECVQDECFLYLYMFGRHVGHQEAVEVRHETVAGHSANYIRRRSAKNVGMYHVTYTPKRHIVLPINVYFLRIIYVANTLNCRVEAGVGKIEMQYCERVINDLKLRPIVVKSS